MKLSDAAYSLDHAGLLHTLAADDKLLIVQDLDGVCMELVRDPLTRRIDRGYVESARRLDGRFQVLTNGEHIGRRGVNRIVEQAFDSPDYVRQHGLYLPGLAAGGVQLQDRYGTVSHPGVKQAEMDFFAAVPDKMRQFLVKILIAPPFQFEATAIESLIQLSVLDNRVSPTLNLNHFYLRLRERSAAYRQLQQRVERFMAELLENAVERQLPASFFVHYAPNIGRDNDGNERLKPGDDDSAGTHDFQFMLRGAVKEVGVLVILNRYYHQQTGTYPLGESFNARTAPRQIEALLQLAREHFDPQHMPRIVGVGDTVTASAQQTGDGHIQMLRGGSDRGFLTLVQALGKTFNTDNAVLYVDSSAGEVQRPGIDAEQLRKRLDISAVGPATALENISDADDPLTLNFVFPGGSPQYVKFFCKLTRHHGLTCPIRKGRGLPF